MSTYPGMPGDAPRHPLHIPGPLTAVDLHMPLAAGALPPVLRCRVTLTMTAKGAAQPEVMQEFEASATEAEIRTALDRLLRAAIEALRSHGIPLAGHPSREAQHGE